MTRTWWGCVKAPKSRSARPAARRPGRTPRPFVELLEERCLLSVEFRTIDGTGNNVANPTWGSAAVDDHGNPIVALLRFAPAAYTDGFSQVVGSPARPSPRLISDRIVAQTTEERVFSDRLMSAMIYGWGQFLDHDLDLTRGGTEPTFDIIVPNDPNDPFSTAATPPGPGVIHFTRSKFVPGTGTSTSNPRQQPNEITAFIDASMVYGSDAFVATALRSGVGGRLRTSEGDLLPFNNTNYLPYPIPLANDSHIVADSQLFAGGDFRTNENIELTSLHTLFLREHNRLADAIYPTLDPTLTAAQRDELAYQQARAIVGAEIQVITYNEWIPALLGPNALPTYTDYKTDVNPGIANEFSTALFRVGHSMLGDDIEFINNDGTEFREGIPLNVGFFNPPQITQTNDLGQQTGVGRILKYLASDPSSEVDTSITDPVRNFLFGQPGAGGFDLSSLNMQRGRDHGLADYNTIRAALGLPQVSSFGQITSDNGLQRKLHDLYGNVDNIDPWIGGLAEDHVSGTSTGPLVRAGLISQFTHLRDGDRFWYQNFFSDDPMHAPFPGAPTPTELGTTTLAAVIARNTEITNLQPNVFFFNPTISGTVFNDANGNQVRDSGEAFLGGRTVQLEDPETNEVLMTTTTDSNGHYVFTVFDGLTTGPFRVREFPQNNWNLTTPNPVLVSVTKGDDNVTVDFGNKKGSGSGFLAEASSSPAALGGTTLTSSDGGSSGTSAGTAAASTGASLSDSFLAALGPASSDTAVVGSSSSIQVTTPAPRDSGAGAASTVAVFQPGSGASVVDATLPLSAAGTTSSGSIDPLTLGQPGDPLPADPFAGEPLA